MPVVHSAVACQGTAVSSLQWNGNEHLNVLALLGVPGRRERGAYVITVPTHQCQQHSVMDHAELGSEPVSSEAAAAAAAAACCSPVLQK